MNKATSVQSFTYLGLVVSEKNVPKNLLTLWGYGLQSPLKRTFYNSIFVDLLIFFSKDISLN